MLIYSRNLALMSKQDNPDIKRMAMELMETNSIFDLAMALAEKIANERSISNRKIVVTQDEMNTIMSIFRVKGFNEDGTPMKKGRPVANSQ